MKIILNKENENTIHIDDITDKHIVVAVIEKNPCVLIRNNYHSGDYRFRPLNHRATNGNGYLLRACETIKKCVQICIDKNKKVQAFHEKDWFKAMRWLNENTNKDEN